MGRAEGRERGQAQGRESFIFTLHFLTMPEALLIRNSFEITSNQFKNPNTLGASLPNSPIIDFIKDFLLAPADRQLQGEGTGSLCCRKHRWIETWVKSRWGSAEEVGKLSLFTCLNQIPGLGSANTTPTRLQDVVAASFTLSHS